MILRSEGPSRIVTPLPSETTSTLSENVQTKPPRGKQINDSEHT